jgi:hypothetical protein
MAQAAQRELAGALSAATLDRRVDKGSADPAPVEGLVDGEVP